MHFYVNLLGFAASPTLLLPAFLILALLTISFIGFWRVAEGICFALFLSDLWDSADIQESAAKTCCSYPSLWCFVANPLALSSSFLTTSLIYGETSVSNTLWDHAVLFLRVTFGMCSHKVKSFLNISYFMGVTEEVMLLLLLLVTVTVCLLSMYRIPSNSHWLITTKLQGKRCCIHFEDEET